MSELPKRDQSATGARRIAVLCAAIGCAAVLVLFLWRGLRRSAEPLAKGDPWAGFVSPYRNTKPGVRYVGDEVCAGCHHRQAESYHTHPMGRSLSPIGSIVSRGQNTTESQNSFEALGAQMRVERRGGKMFQHASVRDTEGHIAVQHEREVHFIIGSGTRTYSYLTNQDGFLLESPITWYAQKRIWDLSPGFSRTYLAGRPVREPCLFCHCNHAEHREGTENGYRPPFFTGYAIGCERCHGPGELHAAFRGEGSDAVPGADDTIVNPGRLEPVLRDAICQQCHLEGSNRIQRRGTRPYDYRPGLPLHRYLSIFVPSPEFGRVPEFVGHVEQMTLSRCYQASAGKLTCITCHDPHAKPAPEQPITFFRERCLKCHKVDSCHLRLAERQKEAGDSCIHCHMPRREAHDLPHTAVTDHRILRSPDQAEPERKMNEPGLGAPLIYFYRDLVGERDPDVARDRGIALMELAWEAPELRQHASALAVPLLEDAVKRWPDDFWAWEAKGKVLWLQGRGQEALAGVEKALAFAPREERILEAAGAMATSMGLNEQAKTYWERALAVNPTRALFHASLAEVLARRHEWADAQKACRSALDCDPFNVEARTLLVRCWLQKGNPDQARAELQILLALQPARADELRRWFARQAR
jgi:Tfp pilus assembly protein PilF